MTINITRVEDAAGGVQPSTATVVTGFDFALAEREGKAIYTFRAAYGWSAFDNERWLETRQPSIKTSKLWAADEARELLIKQLGDDMLAAAKAGDMAKANQLKDLMYAEINHRSLQFIKRRYAEIDQAIGMTTTIGQSHEERLSAIKVVE